MSSTVAMSRSASDATAAAHAANALNSSSFMEKDVTATTMTTLLNGDESQLTPRGDSVEMQWMNSRGRFSEAASGADRHPGTSHSDNEYNHHHMVTFSDDEGIETQPHPAADDHVRRMPSLKSYLSVEHLDTVDDDHHQHHHHHHLKHRKKRKFRGQLGGLHRPRDSTDDGDDEEVVELSRVQQNSGQMTASAAAAAATAAYHHAPQSAAALQRGYSGTTSPGVTDVQHDHRPIYKKSGGDRPIPGTSKQDSVSSSGRPAPGRFVETSSVCSSQPADGPGSSASTSVCGVVGSRRVATSDWVQQQLQHSEQQQQRQSSRVSGDGDSHRRTANRDDATSATANRPTSAGGRRVRSQTSHGVASTTETRGVPENGVSTDTAATEVASAVPPAQSRTRQSRTTGRRAPTSFVLDNSRSTEI